MSTLWLMAGVPGSGKSYFAKNVLKKEYSWFYVSRDEIRYDLVKENEPYFSKEDKVFDVFIHRINFYLGMAGNNDIIADATHISQASRMKLLRRLNLEGVNVIIVWMNTPEHICLERNKQREGRECVPDDVIHNMYMRRQHPANDKFKYAAILEVSGL